MNGVEVEGERWGRREVVGGGWEGRQRVGVGLGGEEKGEWAGDSSDYLLDEAR